jgi:hypothetical protein
MNNTTEQQTRKAQPNDKPMPQAQARSRTNDPPEIAKLRDVLAEETNLGNEISRHDAIRTDAESEIESLLVKCNPSDSGKFAQFTSRIAFAERCIKHLSAQRESVRTSLTSAFVPARNVVARALRRIVKIRIEKEVEVLKDRFSDEQKRRRLADEADEPSKASARAQRFDWATKIDHSTLRDSGVGPEMAQRVLDFWDGATTELKSLGVEQLSE